MAFNILLVDDSATVRAVISKALDQLEFAVSYLLVGDIKVSEVYKDCPFMVI